MADQDSNLVDWSDSFYNYVKQRILTKNPDRVFSGIVEARDWPVKEAVPESLYMLTTTMDPKRMPGSWSAPIYSERIQWVWQIRGVDQAQGVQIGNRGDRYRKHFQICQELMYGVFPGYCEKLSYSLDENNQLQGTSYIPTESIWFTMPTFSDRVEQSSGIMFGSAVLTISGFPPAVTS